MDPGVLIDRLRRLLRRRGRTWDEAEDLIQQAFLRLQEYRQSCQVREPEAFLVRTVQNLSIDAHRAKARHGVHLATEEQLHSVIDPKPLPDEVLATQQRLHRLRQGLEHLSPRTREVVLLHRIEGWSQPQIAARLGISLSGVEKHVAKGALFLADWMAGEEGP
jgi:RNA polymerase sigma factor (sigma-70 family)